MQVTMALATRILRTDTALSSSISVKTTENIVDFDENTDGAIIGDPLAFEMNSHDVLNDNITLITFNRNGGSLF